VLHLRRQVQRRRVAVFRLQRHRLEADRLQSRRHGWLDLARPWEVAVTDLLQHVGDRALRERRLPGQQGVKSCAQAVDIAGRPQLVELLRRLLGAHVPRRADGRAHLRGREAAARAGTKSALAGAIAGASGYRIHTSVRSQGRYPNVDR
jgi:hypothetical protein